jgi:membrane protease YdiL (CAAX protease family)
MLARHPLIAYFAVVFAASAATLDVLGFPRLSPGGVRNPVSLAVFPALVVTVGAAGVALTVVTGGRPVARELWSRMRRCRVNPTYLAVLLVPPASILVTLTALRLTVSSAYAPGLFPIGFTFGLIAGFFEEIGWTGFAYPRLSQRFGALRGSLLLGLLWGLWHLPVVDSLGVASPHGPAWLPFFASFVLAVMAVRLLICWLYARTGSVLLAQLMHASSTGFLVVFSPPQVSAGQEAAWYAVYGALLWAAIATVAILSRFAGLRQTFTWTSYSN